MKPCIFFDVDGTWFRWQLFATWIEYMVADRIIPRSVLEEVETRYRAYRNRTGTFDAYVWGLVEAYHGNGRMRGIRVEDAVRVAGKVIEDRGKEVHVFTRELANVAREQGYATAVISGSPTEVVGEFARLNQVDYWLGTEHPHEDGVYTGGTPKEWFYEKGDCVRMLAERHELDLTRSIAIGDTTSDAKMLEIVGFPLAFNPNRTFYKILQEHCWPFVIERKDMLYVERFYGNADKETSHQEAKLEQILPTDLGALLTERFHGLGFII